MPALTAKQYIEVPPASLDNNRATADKIAAALISLTGSQLVEWPLDVLRDLHRIVKASGGNITVSFEAAVERLSIIQIEPGNATKTNLGVAIDLGTTTLAAELLDLNTGNSLAEAGALNGQIKYGEDLLTRLHLASQGGTEKLRVAILESVNELIQEVCDIAGASTRQVTAVSAAGNTSMTHFFLGLDTAALFREPYTPLINHVPRLKAKDVGLETAPNAAIYFFPSVGSYLGGDLIAGAIASGIAESDEVGLLLDIGTNGEMILGNRDWLIAGAGSAGPALEGGVAECALRAEPGAIDRVDIDPSSLEPTFTVIGQRKPVGLCGSGLIDAVAELYLSGLLDATGRFVLEKRSRRWKQVDGRWAYVLTNGDLKATAINGKAHQDDAQAATCADRGSIYITEKDVQKLLQTKAAMTAALTILLDSVGLSLGDIRHIYTAGSFGLHVAVDSAIAIGLYPRLAKERFVSLGNSSLKGAKDILLDREKTALAHKIADKITYLELNVHPAFMGIFRGAKYI